MEVLQRTANRGSISTGYDIDNSLKFEPDNSEYLKSNNTHAYTTPTSDQIGTVSFWIKRTEIGNNVSGKQMYIFASANSARYSNLGFDEFDNLTLYSGDSSWNSVAPYTSNKFRDTSAWYHIVLRYDSTDGTASNRLRVYSNGTEVSWAVAPNITQNGVMTIGALGGPTWHSWGTIYAYFTPIKFFAGYLAEAHFVDGQSLAPTEFGEYDEDSGIWKPKAYTGTYGNAGYYLDFADSGNLGDDESGNGFDFDENNITSADQATDTPTNNFATLNPLLTNAGSANYLTMTEGATKGVNAGNAYRLAVGSMGVTSGKWYWEVKATSISNTMYMGITYPSIWDTDYSLGGTIFLDDNNDPVRYNNDNRSSFGSAFGNGDIIAFALDMDASTPTMTVYKNNSSLGNLMAGLSINGAGGAFLPPKENGYFPKIGGYGAATWECNFGGYTSATPASPASDQSGYGTFEYAPPTGYYALCTKNLAEFG